MTRQTLQDRDVNAFRLRRAEALGGSAAVRTLAASILAAEEADKRDGRRMRACDRLRTIGGAMWRRAFVGSPWADVLAFGADASEVPAAKLAAIEREYNAHG